jgi:hypothetical protein
MRPFEILLILVVIAAALSLMVKSAVRFSIPLTFFGVLFCTWHVVREGTHWQMIPVLIGLMILVIWQLTPADLRVSRHRATQNRVAVSIALLSLASFVILLLVPMFSLPKPTGPYPVGTRIVYLKDSSRV